ncbi:helix-turn-helix transcriptional regulator [Streptomyces albipurpureus]|uniref:Helix-turn-helix transcriptional regulator n=1 Tax=Streptomyces albipurpureus TaxID=2897419 RepID=A0ABT0UN90_9ACTN|nr:helix-turn-helix transcriptional regulator [Streptomyces sp. CWNU-1]MCM2389909.1 helix-turn-helix transcriptional regulator [Streptomyces sp. CWNU-1]
MSAEDPYGDGVVPEEVEAAARAAYQQLDGAGESLEVLPEAVREWLAARRLVDGERGHVCSPERALHELVADQRRGLGELEQGLNALHDVLRLMPGLRPPGRAVVEAEFFADRSRLQDRMDDLDTLCLDEILGMRANFPDPDALEKSLGEDLAMLARGVRIALLVATRAARQPGAARYLSRMHEHGARIRLAPAVPLHLNVVDRAVTVLALGPVEDGAEPAEDVVLRSPRLASCFARVFEHHWGTGIPYGADCAEEWTPREREVLALLAAGTKDETIARRLGCSERTLRRLLAGLVTRLGAESRFAAGVRAARLGLLDGP